MDFIPLKTFPSIIDVISLNFIGFWFWETMKSSSLWGSADFSILGPTGGNYRLAYRVDVDGYSLVKHFVG